VPPEGPGYNEGCQWCPTGTRTPRGIRAGRRTPAPPEGRGGNRGSEEGSPPNAVGSCAVWLVSINPQTPFAFYQPFTQTEEKNEGKGNLEGGNHTSPAPSHPTFERQLLCFDRFWGGSGPKAIGVSLLTHSEQRPSNSVRSTKFDVVECAYFFKAQTGGFF